MNKKTIVTLLMILAVAAFSATPASAQKKCGSPCGTCPSAIVCEPSENCLPCRTCSHDKYPFRINIVILSKIYN